MLPQPNLQLNSEYRLNSLSATIVEYKNLTLVALLCSLKKDEGALMVYNITKNHEIFKRKPDPSTAIKFTCQVADQAYTYVGTQVGSVQVYETLSGNFIKEIPLQY